MRSLLLIALLSVSSIVGRRSFRPNSFNLEQPGPADYESFEFTIEDLTTCGQYRMTAEQEQTLKTEKELATQMPWTVYILREEQSKLTPVCVGGLLNDIGDTTDTVVTASNCVNFVKDAKHFVYTGTKFPVDPSDKNNLYEVVSKKPNIVSPMDYVIVLTLRRQIKVKNEKRQALCLPHPLSAIPADKICVISTLKRVGQGDEYEPTTQFVNHEDDACEQLNGKVTAVDKKSEFCAVHHFQGGIAKGSPLMCREKQGWVLYGVYAWSAYTHDMKVSYVDDTPKPGVYMEVVSKSHILQSYQSTNVLAGIEIN